MDLRTGFPRSMRVKMEGYVHLARMIDKAKAAGYAVTEDVPVEGYDRRHIYDPFGNRIELIEPHPG